MKIKKIISLLLAFVILLSLSTFAFAEEGDASFSLISYKVYSSSISPEEKNIKVYLELKAENAENKDIYITLDNSCFVFNLSSFEIENRNKIQENILNNLESDKKEDRIIKTQTKCYVCQYNVDKNKFTLKDGVISGYICVDATKNIGYGQTSFIDVTLNVDGESNTTVFKIPVNTAEEQQDIPVEPEETESTLTPHLFITGYDISTDSISAGEDFKLTVNFKNTSKTEDIENVIMTYSLPAGMALAKASTNFYFPKVAKDSTASQTVTITSDGSLMDGLQNIGIAFSYEYKNESEVYTQGSDSETLSVKVGATAGEEQDDRFEISSIDLPDMVYLGQEEYITINLINKGSKALNNVSAKINSENISNNGYNEYLGQVAANSKGEIELVINPSTAGDIIGTITVSYEHEDGTVVETTRDFTVFCEDPNAWMDDPGMYDPGAFDEPIEEKKFPVWGYVLIGVGAVAVVVAAVVITKKVIKNKKEKALEEELDEDI